MVRFGQHLKRVTEPDYSDAYVPYKLLKKLIKKHEAAQRHKEDTESNTCDEAVLSDESPRIITAGINDSRLPDENHEPLSSIEGQFVQELQASVDRLNDFLVAAAEGAEPAERKRLGTLAEVNYTAVCKIVKKYRKKCSTNSELERLVAGLKDEPFMKIHCGPMDEARRSMLHCVNLMDPPEFTSDMSDVKLQMFESYLLSAEKHLKTSSPEAAEAVSALRNAHEVLFDLGGEEKSTIAMTHAKTSMSLWAPQAASIIEKPRVETSAPSMFMSVARKCVPPAWWVWTSGKYTKMQLKQDIIAGITIAIFGIPQGIAYAGLAGVPPVHGMYAVIFPALLYSFLTQSRQCAIGPMSVPCLIMGTIIDEYGLATDYERVLLMCSLTSAVGLVFLIMGVLRLGFLLSFVSKPVLSGFAAGCGMITTLSVSKDLLGTHPKKATVLHVLLPRIVESLPETHWPTLLLSIGAIISFKLLGYLSALLKKRSTPDPNSSTMTRSKKVCAFLSKVPTTLIFIGGGILVGGSICGWQRAPNEIWEPKHEFIGTGASLPVALYHAVSDAYSCRFHESGVAASYRATSTGVGQAEILAAHPSVSFAGMDVRPSNVAVSDLLLLPTMATAVCPVVHLPFLEGSSVQVVFSRETLAAIFSGNITHWNDQRIVASNPNVKQLRTANQRIVVVARGDSSGTHAVFSKALAAFSEQRHQLLSSGQEATIPAAEVLSNGNKGMIASLASRPFSIGYASVSAVRVDQGGNAVLACAGIERRGNSRVVDFPSREAVMTAVQRADALHLNDLAHPEVSSAPGAWPISTYSYVAVRAEAHPRNEHGCARRQHLHNFLKQLVDEEHDDIRSAHGFVNLPRASREAHLLSMRRLLCDFDTPLRTPVLHDDVQSHGCAKEHANCAGHTIVGRVPTKLPEPSLPRELLRDSSAFLDLMSKACLLAIVCLAEHVTNVKLYASKHHYEVEGNTDLVALGLSNIFGSFFGAWAVGGSFTRSAVNNATGATSQLSLLVSALVSIVIMCTIAPALYFLPKAILSVVVLFAVLKLVDYRFAQRLWSTYKPDLLIMAVAWVVTLFAGIMFGLFTAVAFSLIVFVHHTTELHIEELGRVAGSATYVPAHILPQRSLCGTTDEEEQLNDDVLRSDVVKVVKVGSALHYVNAPQVCAWIQHFAGSCDSLVKCIVLDLSAVAWCDSTAAESICTLCSSLESCKIKLVLAAGNPKLLQILESSRRYEHHPSVHAAMLMQQECASV